MTESAIDARHVRVVSKVTRCSNRSRQSPAPPVRPSLHVALQADGVRRRDRGAASDVTFARSLADASSAVPALGRPELDAFDGQSVVTPDQLLLAAVRDRALAAGLHPSAATVYRTAVRDLGRSMAVIGRRQPQSQTEAATSSSTTLNPNQPDGVGYVAGGTTAGVAPASTVDLGAPSADTQTYLQQLFALEADPAAAAAAANSGSWPSEATNGAWRRQAIIQFAAVEVGSGPAYHSTSSLTNAQVLAAQAWAEQSPALNLNPAYAVALARAADVAGRAQDGTARLPWAGQDPTLLVVPGGSYGTTALSGYYGTGIGLVPADAAS